VDDEMPDILGRGEANDGDLENDAFMLFFIFVFLFDVDEKFSIGDRLSFLPLSHALFFEVVGADYYCYQY
jgi:hypothetical protein